MHAVRRKALYAAIESSLHGHPLAVTTLGRGPSGSVDEKHQLKRMDRVLSNPHLQAQRVQLYTDIARLIIGGCQRPVIAVGWSDLDGAKRHYLLRASLIVEGRALTLLEEVHTLAGKDRRRTHQRLLTQGERARSGHSEQNARREREPWLLVTSLSVCKSRKHSEI